jgi:hypothetical protein
VRRDQQNIYKNDSDENLSQNQKNTNKLSKAIQSKILIIIKFVLGLPKNATAIVIFFLFVWNFFGQFFLPQEDHFPTYMGRRGGETEAEAIRTALPEERNKASAIAKEQAAVEVDKSCVSLRNDRAIQTYYECLAQSGTRYLCDHRRDQIQQQPCGSFESSQHKTQQEGDKP